MSTASPSAAYTVKAIEYHVASKSEPGTQRTVRVNPLTNRPMSCDCPARVTCRHMKAVAAGEAGRPRVRIGPAPRFGRTTIPAAVTREALPDERTARIQRVVSDLYGEA